MQDTAYRDFHSRLVPNLDKNIIIGVRTPILRSFTNELIKRGDLGDFLKNLPHKYYEENNIHAIILENIKDFDECVHYLQEFLPYVDNWATCDMLRPKCFKKNTDQLFPYILKWINDERTYVVRFAIGMLNSYFLDEHFDESHLKMVCDVESSEYYVNMMRAWYFATALAKQYDKTVLYFENKLLYKWTHNKAIQKSVESYRISENIKEYLKSLKIKAK